MGKKGSVVKAGVKSSQGASVLAYCMFNNCAQLASQNTENMTFSCSKLAG